MRQPHINDRVRVIRGIPELCLHHGDAGVVRSIWFSPYDFYEVILKASELPARCLVQASVIEVDDQESSDESSG